MRRQLALVVLLGDSLALASGVVLASVVVFGTPLPWRISLQGDASLAPLLTSLEVGLLVGSYLSLRMWHRSTGRPTYGRAVAIVSVALAVTMVSIVIGRGYWSRPFLAWTAATWLLGSLVLRFALRQRPWTERVIIISSEKQLVADLERSPHLSVTAVVDPAGEPPTVVSPDTTLALDLRSVMSDRTAQFVASWNLAGAPIKSITRLYEEHLGRFPLLDLVYGWEVSTPVETNAYERFKRPLDLVLTVTTMPIWLLLSALIGVAVRLDSPGPAIYSQVRVGAQGRHITLHKFRTMRLDSEQDGPRFAEVNDSRLTRVGRWLRRTRLDELPQLWNVLKGDLSLVGPRPERPFFVQQFERAIPFYSSRTLVRAGVTGWAQVNYGYADDLADAVEKLTYDLYYMKHMSLWLDLQVLGKSVWTVVSGFGAR